jgi:hypothetical protein
VSIQGTALQVVMGEKEAKDLGFGERAERSTTPPFKAWISIAAAEPKSWIAKACRDCVGLAADYG